MKLLFTLTFLFITQLAYSCNQQKIDSSSLTSNPITELESIDIYQSECNQFHSWMGMVFIPNNILKNDYFLFILFHEYAHIKLKHKTVATNSHQQEFDADHIALELSQKYHLDIENILKNLKKEEKSESISHPSSAQRHSKLLTHLNHQ